MILYLTRVFDVSVFRDDESDEFIKKLHTKLLHLSETTAGYLHVISITFIVFYVTQDKDKLMEFNEFQRKF